MYYDRTDPPSCTGKALVKSQVTLIRYVNFYNQHRNTSPCSISLASNNELPTHLRQASSFKFSSNVSIFPSKI